MYLLVMPAPTHHAYYRSVCCIAFTIHNVGYLLLFIGAEEAG